MKLKIEKSGTLSEVRAAVNDAVHATGRTTSEDQAVRAIAAHAADALDAIHDPWQVKCNKARGAGLDEPTEPRVSLKINATVDVSALSDK